MRTLVMLAAFICGFTLIQCESLCPDGDPHSNINGTQTFCGRGPNREDCPSDYYCSIDPSDRFAVCCREPGTCPEGEPLVNQANSMIIFCGRGPNRMDCPNDYYCNIDPADAFAVCCQSLASSVMPAYFATLVVFFVVLFTFE